MQEGGTLITEGSTATIFPDTGSQRRHCRGTGAAFVRGSILRAKITDMKSPIGAWPRERRPAGVFQPVAGAERGGRRVRRLRRRWWTRGRAGDQPERRHRPERRRMRCRCGFNRSRRTPTRRRPARGERPRPTTRAAAPDGAEVRHHHRRHPSARGDAVGQPDRHAAVGTLLNGQFLATARRSSTPPSARGTS